MVEHPLGMNIEQNKAFLERVFWHMVGIVNLVHEKREIEPGRWVKSQQIGTGSACEFKGVKFILTAKHLLEGAGASDLAFLPRPTGRIEWAGEPRRTRVERILLGIERIVTCEWEDLAAIVLQPHHFDSLNIEFCRLPDKLGGTPTSGAVLIAGYPSDQAFAAETAPKDGVLVNNLVAASSAFWGEPVVPRKLLGGFDPEFHFVAKFVPDFEGGRPHGYSGAGAWYTNPTSPNPSVWTADPVLMGVETYWYPDSQLVRIVRPEVVKGFLEQALTGEAPPPDMKARVGQQ